MSKLLQSYSAFRWVPCPGSVRLEAMFPEQETDPDRAEGKASHWALSELLRDNPVALGQVADNGVVLTDELIDAAEVTADYVQERRGSSAVELHIEQWADNPVAKAKPDVWFALHDPSSGRLRIVVAEHKTGHKHVEVWGNWQLTSYAWGIVQHLGITPDADHLVTFDLVVSQPRDFHRDGPIRVWTVGLAELRPMFNELADAALESAAPDPAFMLGSWCGDCRGRWACEPLTRAGRLQFDVAGSSLPLKLPAAALGAELRRVNQALELLKARQSGLEEAATHMIRAGQRVPGWSIESTAGREKWKRPDADIIAMGAMLGLNVAKPAQAITPPQARKLGMDPEQMKRLAERTGGAMVLVEDDGRALKRAFGGKP